MKRYIIIILLTPVINFCFAQGLQPSIDKYSLDIDNFYSSEKRLKNIPKDYEKRFINSKDKLQKEKQELDELIDKFKELDYLKISINLCSKISNKSKNIEFALNDYNKRKSDYDLRKNYSRERLLQNKQESSAILIKIGNELPSGEIEFIYNKKKYIGFIADMRQQDISILFKDNKGNKFVHIDRASEYLESQNKNILMLCNGGMYSRKFDPVGLLIIDGKQYKPLDTNSKKISDNFHMYPNGVFYLDKDSAYLTSTHEYRKSIEDINPIYATQSGPMLVINGKHHSSFNYGSKNLNIRNGVGILPNGRVLFLISKGKINLFDFATVYQDIFGCKNALYLDGAISKMYLETKNTQNIQGTFGPFISVTTEKKESSKNISRKKKAKK